jgi:F0F1-type ATP synthase assembly protein I
MKKNNKREFTITEKSIGIGVMTGTIVGVLTDNIGLWLPLGIVLGVVIGTTQKNTKI